MQTPVSLLERLCQPHQEKAWERFVELYTPFLYSWARRATGHELEAADLVQEVLALLVRKLPSFRYDQHKSFRSWLRTVALNCWRNLRRKANVARDPNAPDPDELAAPDAEDPFWEVEYRQRLVGRALEFMRAEFQPTTWQACWHCVVEDRSPIEVARELGISTGAVYMAKSRVLSRLRKELEGLVD